MKHILAYRLFEGAEETIRIYRGMENKFDDKYDTSKSDAPHGYSTWTDSLELAKQYAGENGHVYYMDLPKSQLGKSAIDEDPNSETYGDRTLFYFDDKPAGLNDVKGKEVLVYTFHELYDPKNVRLLESDIHEGAAIATRFEISFTNPRFFISDNTVNAFVNRLRKMDPELFFDEKASGRMKDSKVIYIESNKLTHPDIKGEFAGFVQKYDNLQMRVVIPRR